MRIDLFNPAAAQLPSENSAQPAKAGNSLALNHDGAGDRTTLTSGSTVVSALVGEVMNTPEIRQDKVQNLQQAIASGQYELDPQQIAGAMIDEHA